MEAGAFAAIQIVTRELALFAALGFLILGLSDLAVDLLWIGGALRRRLGGEDREQVTAAALPPPREPGLLAVFVPAWDEGRVIEHMLRSTLSKFEHGDYRIYVGCYSNDPATIAAVRAVGDPRIRLVIGPAPGPTTKADCLNRLWEAMLDDEDGIMYQMHQAPATFITADGGIKGAWTMASISPAPVSFASAPAWLPR